jgi:hypothetical protein
VVAGLAVSGAVTLGVFGYRWVQRTEQELKDPDTRLARVRQVLGCKSLPEGYHPVVGLSLPLLSEIAVLSDRPLPEGEERGEPFGERGFIYVKVLAPGQDEQELRDYFEGKTADAGVLRRNGIELRTREPLGRGVIEHSGQSLLYQAQRGDVDFSAHGARGVTSLILVDCPLDRKLRFGIWFGPDPAAGGDAGADALAGTPADPAAIRAFMGHFRLCGQAAPSSPGPAL